MANDFVFLFVPCIIWQADGYNSSRVPVAAHGRDEQRGPSILHFLKLRSDHFLSSSSKAAQSQLGFPYHHVQLHLPFSLQKQDVLFKHSRVSVNCTSDKYKKAEKVPYLWHVASPAQPPVSALTAPSSPSCCLLYPDAPGSPPARPKPPGGCLQRPGSPGSPEACLWPSSAEPDTPSGAGPSLWPRLLTPGRIQREPGPPDRDAQQTPYKKKKKKRMNYYCSDCLTADLTTFTTYAFRLPFIQTFELWGLCWVFPFSPALLKGRRLLFGSLPREQIHSWGWDPSASSSLLYTPHNHQN